MQLYRDESSNPTWNAQRNLGGRTHYVEDDTLRFHKSRVLETHCTDNGLLFAIVTSDALDARNMTRGFRYVIFDVFGTVLDRPTLEEASRTKKQAVKAMWAHLNDIDAYAHTLKAIDRQEAQHISDMEQMRLKVHQLATENKKAA